MASQVEITVPNVSTSATSKPYTLYNISLRLPLRSFTLQKRYSDFIALHDLLTSQTGQAPPYSLPPKSYFTNSTSSPALAEERRKGFEAYLNSINSAEDERWRNTSAWRTFLNLPTTATSRSMTASNLHSVVAGATTPTTDPVVWLDQHRDLKGQLHDSRLHLTKRDQAVTAQAQHEASAQAKKCLVRAGTMIASLDRGLKNMSDGSASWNRGRLGEGEMRRRRDLLSSATREKEGLENLLNAMAAKSALDRTVAAAQEKGQLVHGPQSNGNARQSKPASGRVLGKETTKTKALDNAGVLQLQQQMFEEQDEDVTVLAQAVARQKELGIQIQQEIAVQEDLLDMLQEDVDRVQGKVDIGRKRVNKIS